MTLSSIAQRNIPIPLPTSRLILFTKLPTFNPSYTMDAQGEIDVSRLSDRDKQELQQFIVNETQKSKIQQCMSSTSIVSFMLRH